MRPALDYSRAVISEAGAAFLRGLKSPVMGLILLAVAYLLARWLYPGQWISASFWEDVQKGAFVLTVWAVIAFGIELLRAPYTLHQRQAAQIAALTTTPTPPVSPLQQTFNYNFYGYSQDQIAGVVGNAPTSTGTPTTTVIGSTGDNAGGTTTPDESPTPEDNGDGGTTPNAL